MPSALLHLDKIKKSFAGTCALKPFSLELAAGEVLGLIGENGAGKSTLIKILSGVFPPDAGTMAWRGAAVSFRSPRDALIEGIATIHQELAYCGHLTVAENLLLGQRWPRFRWGGVDWAALHQRARAQLARCGLDLDTRRAMTELSAAQKQEVAIARALDRRAQLLVLDEPTASLSEPEVERLFAQVQRVRAGGVAVLYVSHRLEEILKLTDRVVVLRDGQQVATYRTSETDVNRMVRDMVGRPLEQVYPRTRHVATLSDFELNSSRSKMKQEVAGISAVGHREEPLLKLENVSRDGMFRDINLAVHGGEIVGLAGLVGAGRSELARAIYGLYPHDTGILRLRGREWCPRGPHDSLAAGLVYLPEERKRQSLVLEHSVADSISIGFSDLLARWGLIPRGTEASRVRKAMKTYDVRAGSAGQLIGSLSGGNQQKAVLARWLERDPNVILLDEPTRGVDVGAKAEIHALIDQLAARGCAVLLISSDLPEVLGMSDRLLVMHRGTIAAELRGSGLTQENVLLAASGFPVIHN